MAWQPLHSSGSSWGRAAGAAWLGLTLLGSALLPILLCPHPRGDVLLLQMPCATMSRWQEEQGLFWDSRHLVGWMLASDLIANEASHKRQGDRCGVPHGSL